MKGLIFGGLSALLLTTATAVLAEPGTRVGAELSQIEPSGMVFNFSAPIITNSGVRGTTHFIKIAVIGMTLQDLSISIPPQMEQYDAVRVVDQTGQEIASKISRKQDQLLIAFNQPVSPGGYLQVEFTGVQMRTSNDGVLLYGVTGERVGLRGNIPIGTARVQIPNRS